MMADKDVEVGTSRSLSTAGRDLVHAAVRAGETYVAAGVARDGRRVAVVLPCGPQDHTPSKAEMGALMAHLMYRSGPAFKPDAQPDETQLLGRALAQFLDYLGSDILAVAEAALTESDMHGTAMAVRELRGRHERGESL